MDAKPARPFVASRVSKPVVWYSPAKPQISRFAFVNKLSSAFPCIVCEGLRREHGQQSSEKGDGVLDEC